MILYASHRFLYLHNQFLNYNHDFYKFYLCRILYLFLIHFADKMKHVNQLHEMNERVLEKLSPKTKVKTFDAGEEEEIRASLVRAEMGKS